MPRVPPAMRPPSWAAWEAMVAAGLSDAADVARWREAFDRSDALVTRPWMHIATFVAGGRVPVSPPAG